MIVYSLVTKKEANNIFNKDGVLPKKFYYFLDNVLYLLEKGKEKEDGECMLLAFDIPTNILKKSMRFESLDFSSGDFSKEIMGSTIITNSQFYFPTFYVEEANEVNLIGVGIDEKICAKKKEEQENIFTHYYLNRSSYQHYLKDMESYTKYCDEKSIIMFLENNKDLFFTDDVLQFKNS